MPAARLAGAGVGPLLLAALAAVLGLACTGDEEEVDASVEALGAQSFYWARVNNRTLIITGIGAGPSRLALRLQTPARLVVDVNDDGSADFVFLRSTFDRIRINGGAGNDFIRMDESNGSFTNEQLVSVDGGRGNDTLLGGVGPETLIGGRGADLVQGGPGVDTVSLGQGDDTFVWNPGDGNDLLEGEDGNDRIVLNGSNASEQIDLATQNGRLRLFRNIGNNILDAGGFERVDVNVRGGDDRVVVNDLPGAAVTRVNVSLAAAPGANAGDGQPDVVVVQGTTTPHTIDVSAEGAAVVARGLPTVVSVTGGEPAIDAMQVNAGAGDVVNVNGSAGADTMDVREASGRAVVQATGFTVAVDVLVTLGLSINGRGGNDVLRVVAATMALPLRLDGGAGNDRLDGGPFAETLLGGPGDDVIDGNRGDDTALMGAGNDTFVWDPGDGSDVVEGEGGADALVFNGANVSEVMELSPNGGRLALFRNVGNIVMDVNGVERVALNVLGGSDAVTVHDLAGTGVARVDLDLAGAGGTGDGATDSVVLEGTAGADIVTLVDDGAALGVLGLPVQVVVSGGERALDTLTVNGLGGADILRVTAEHSSVALRLEGGAGDDRLEGGPGDEVMAGGQGVDVALMGAGNDTFEWNPGDGSDIIEGQQGTDQLVFTGANVSEAISVAANGGRVTLFRNVGNIVMDLAGVERIDVNARGGADQLVVGDLSGTGVTLVNLDLEPAPGAATGDGQLDSVVVQGSAASDVIAVGVSDGAPTVSGLAATTRVAHPDPTDLLQVQGGGGADSFTVDPAVVGLITLLTQD